MDLFKNRIQPTIVHLGSYNGIKDKYFLNYNVVQIDWFANNSIVLEDGSGVLTLESADDTNPFSALSHGFMDVMEDGVYDGTSVLDIPRIYFPITNKFISNTGEAVTPNVINSFITTILHLSDNCVEHALPDNTSYIADFIINGESFDGIALVPGVDYYINETFANYLITIDLNVEYPDLVPEGIELYDKIQRIKSITLPNYLDKESNIREPWIPLTVTEENNTDLTLYYNINYLGELVNTYDLANFYSSFCQLILDKSNIEIQLSDFQNLKYKKVLEYFANGKTDEASQMIQLILGSQFNSAQTINTASQLCKCNSNNSSTGISSCSSLYNDAMTELLKEMLGNVEFYRDWFYDVQEDKSMKVNDELVKYLKLLIKGFVDAGYDLSFSNNYKLNCGCQTSTNLASTANYNIINKYDEVLNYVLSCSLQYNINKTKLYGSQFGELLPKLQF